MRNEVEREHQSEMKRKNKRGIYTVYIRNIDYTLQYTVYLYVSGERERESERERDRYGKKRQRRDKEIVREVGYINKECTSVYHQIIIRKRRKKYIFMHSANRHVLRNTTKYVFINTILYTVYTV